MTDRFEDAVRDAARGLVDDAVDQPGYQHAWQRGRRRRALKRTALGVAGVIALVVGLSVNLGPFGGTSTDVDDGAVPGGAVATLDGGTTPEPAPTSEPAVASATATAVLPTQTPQTDAAASSVVGTESTAPVVPEPTATVAPTVPPAPTTTPNPSAGDPPSATATETDAPATASTDDGTTPAPTSVSGASGDAPELQTLARPADAVVVSEVFESIAECEVVGDGPVDAVCELLAPYACTTDMVRAGYQAFDDDGDGTVDLCRAVNTTMCDTTGDGLGDIACIINLVP